MSDNIGKLLWHLMYLPAVRTKGGKPVDQGYAEMIVPFESDCFLSNGFELMLKNVDLDYIFCNSDMTFENFRDRIMYSVYRKISINSPLEIDPDNIKFFQFLMGTYNYSELRIPSIELRIFFNTKIMYDYFREMADNQSLRHQERFGVAVA